MESSDDELIQNRCFREWMNLQEQDLSDPLEALNNADHHTTTVGAGAAGGEGGDDNPLHLRLIQRSVEHLQDYVKKRNELARNDVSPYFAPKWCSSLEGSMLWIGGCRPSMFIRLLCAIIGKDTESGMEDYLRGQRNGKLGDVSARQMNMINNLQRKFIEKEDKLTAKLTGLQEDMADQPIANDASCSHREENRDADVALGNHAKLTVTLLEEADKLRVESLKEVISVLNPLQAVEFLAASKKLHLCIREWGGRRDDRHGRTTN